MTIPNEIVRRVFPMMCPSLPKTIFDLDGIMIVILLEACRWPTYRSMQDVAS
jgi:hypothetical protein